MKTKYIFHKYTSNVAWILRSQGLSSISRSARKIIHGNKSFEKRIHKAITTR
jgi:hypothetical protein